MKQKLMWIVWPAFLMAGVMELLVFALVDPGDMHWFGHSFEISRQGAYTLGFFVFWTIISVAGALTLFLSLPANEVNQSPL